MTECVVDTNVASFILDDRPELSLYLPHLRVDMVVLLPFQVVAEMRLGALNRDWGRTRRQLLQSFIDSLEVIDYTDELGMRWAEVMHVARRVGKRLEAADAWIAATALLRNVPLLTHDLDLASVTVPGLSLICHAPKA